MQLTNEEEMWADVEDDVMVNSMDGCIFCTRKIRRRNGCNQKTTVAKTEAKKNHIFDILRALHQQSKVDEFQNSQPVEYHLSCLAEMEHKISLATKIEKQEIHRQTVNMVALEKIKESVKSTVIDKREVRMLSEIHQCYVAFFDEQKSQGVTESCEPVFRSQYLLQQILRKFPELTRTVYKNKTFLHLKNLPTEEIFAKGQQQEDLVVRSKKVAFEIRKIVKKMNVTELPKRNLTLKHIIEGECSIPKELYVLIECLVKGPRAMNSTIKDKKISSICSSIIYTMTNGAIKPSSCITLGLCTKSITGSQKMVNILNRMGFCINYTLVQELETELAYECSTAQRIVPYGLKVNNPNLRTHIAFDNYDKFVETSSGKDTLHDTVGIVYQNMDNENIIEAANISLPDSTDDDRTNITDSDISYQRRRKYYSTLDSSIELYSKPHQKPTVRLHGNDPMFPDMWQKGIDLNAIWMFNFAFELEETKRWFAWNAERTIDKNPLQNIGYLPNLNHSPTSDAVVLKTLQIAKDVAAECNQRNIIVTYDLAIASKAYRIQSNMAPQFDNVFITLGPFHIELSFFKVFILN